MVERRLGIPAFSPIARGAAEPSQPAAREALGVLLKVIDEHDPGSLEDLNRMGHLAYDTARRLKLPEAEARRIELAARLHDVGKLAIPDWILHKAGPLNAEEWLIMRTHTQIGARIAAAAPSLATAEELILHNHERYDGEGYPDGLSGDQVPIGAYVVGTCAAFVAMMRHRPYSDAITVAEALAELQRCSGAQFHPAVVTAFCELFA